MGLTTSVAMFLKSIFTIVGIYAVLFSYSWKITLIAMSFCLPMFIIMPLWQRLTMFSTVQYQAVKAEASSTATETIGNIKTVKAFSGEVIGMKEFNKHNMGALNIGKNMAYYYAVMMVCMQIFFNGGYIGIAWFAVQEVKSGEMSLGETSAFLLYNW